MTGIRTTSHSTAFRALLFAAAFLAAFVAWPAHAGNYTFSNDIRVTLEGSGINLDIVAGSTADSWSIGTTTLTVTVAATETFTVRYPGPNPGDLANDGGLASCTYSGGNNVLAIAGPATVVITPSATPECVAPSGGGGTSSGASLPPQVSVVSPNGGETLAAGSSHVVQWSTSGGSMISARLTLSTDGGATYPHVVAKSEPNDGVMTWTVPDLSTSTARLRVEGLTHLGDAQASDASDADFTITGSVADAIAEPPEDISEDKGMEDDPTDPLAQLCGPDRLVKSPSATAVYYCGKDGRRYVFPHQKVYLSWYADFSGVTEITDAELAGIPLGGNVTYKPGSRMIKIQSDPKVYLVARGGLLRWITTEEVAAALYGPAWNTRIDDVNAAFFVNYAVGDPITMQEVEEVKERFGL